MKAYETLELEIIKFEAQDVITSSAVEDVPPVEDDHDPWYDLTPEVQAQIQEMLADPNVKYVNTNASGEITGWEDHNGEFHPIEEW